MPEPILKMKNISKRFSGVQALKNVSFDLFQGEVLCLVGENGAGKSTLMKILTGVIRADEGEIFLNGQKALFKTPMDAYRNGISIVHQELLQIPEMSVEENIFIGRYKSRLGMVDYHDLHERTIKLMNNLGIFFEPESKVGRYSVAQRQLIEILKALSFDSSIVVFDEPTAALTQDESRILFEIIKKLTQHGISVIFISHRLEDIFEIGDRILVLRDGQVTGTNLVKGLKREEIIRLMVGRELSQQYGEKNNVPGEVILSARNIRTAVVKDVSFELHKGEVLGIAGLIGAGRTELLRAIFGIDQYKGDLIFEGKAVQTHSPRGAIQLGFSMVPEDRKEQGLILMHSIVQNIELNNLRSVSKHGFMARHKEVQVAEKFVEKLSIRASSVFAKANSLSGGNQQKVVIAKGLISNPRVVLLDEPTRGVDVGAKAEIYRIINTLACAGVSILMVSSELPELLGICDRIMVMKEGKLTGTLDRKDATEEAVMRLAI